MKISVKVGNVKVQHEDTVTYTKKHSETVIKLLKEMVVQAVKLAKE